MILTRQEKNTNSILLNKLRLHEVHSKFQQLKAEKAQLWPYHWLKCIDDKDDRSFQCQYIQGGGGCFNEPYYNPISLIT